MQSRGRNTAEMERMLSAVLKDHRFMEAYYASNREEQKEEQREEQKEEQREEQKEEQREEQRERQREEQNPSSA